MEPLTRANAPDVIKRARKGDRLQLDNYLAQPVTVASRWPSMDAGIVLVVRSSGGTLYRLRGPDDPVDGDDRLILDKTDGDAWHRHTRTNATILEDAAE